jgi:hypothetical protein
VVYTNGLMCKLTMNFMYSAILCHTWQKGLLLFLSLPEIGKIKFFLPMILETELRLTWVESFMNTEAWFLYTTSSYSKQGQRPQITENEANVSHLQASVTMSRY